MKKFFLFNSILCLMVFSCNLDTEEGQLIDQNGNNDAITEEESPQGELLNVGNQNMRFSIFEVVSIDISGEQFSEGIEEGTLSDGSKLDLFLSQGNLSFVVPKLNQGKYTLQFSQSSRLFDLEFEVKPHDLKEDPKTYLQRMEVVSKASFDALESNITFLSKEDQTKLAQDIQSLKMFSEEQWAKAALLTEEELVDLAFFVEANREWIEELNNAVNELIASNFNSRLESNGVSNYEQRAYEISKAFVKSIIIVVGKIPTILASTGTGFLAGGPLGAAVGLGISLGYLLPDILNVFSTLDRFGDEILVVKDSELGVSFKADYVFENDESNELILNREYRTLYAGDKNSTYPFIQELISNTDQLFESWNKLKSKLMVEIGYESRNFSELPSFTNKNLRVHSDHLSVSGISNAKVSSSEKKEAGKFFITFSTTEKEPQDFEFSIVYNNQFFDKTEKKVSAKLEVEEEIVGCEGAEIFIDPRDGTVYNIIEIGSQCWFAENLNFSGDIPEVQDGDAWRGLSTPAWCHYENDASNGVIYGKLYNYFAVESGDLCPEGWHVPTDQEWGILTDYLGGRSIAGGKMKSVSGWEEPNREATNESGFTALPASSRNGVWGNFPVPIGFGTTWWATNPSPNWGRGVNSDFGDLYLYFGDLSNFKRNGFSCRCIKDQ
ncbi:FISUMP domain-containing protein [Cecembia lonarensis]|uniref:Fibrobacter succinogenes major paralogous domain-containing protein n=1 Tax=Cecembia lonarensis (strain CCUG 58316 / KCTC 22772 / LW9) TaxID=1225176 RepID=K1M233_CECL9|nr:FISUMP domain-containing protein [Cecembia lonarensis]EKB50324.1 hypothetical protein B879_01032 [Cecembia lonarensis LW9]